MGVSSRARPRQRIAKACTRCRIKKIKCDGASPCSSCKFQDTMCQYAERIHHGTRQVPSGYVEHLEQQRKFLVQVLKEVWKMQISPPSSGAPQTLQRDYTPTLHEIISDFGVEMDVPDHFDSDESAGNGGSPMSKGTGSIQSSDYSQGTRSPGEEIDDDLSFDSGNFLSAINPPAFLPESYTGLDTELGDNHCTSQHMFASDSAMDEPFSTSDPIQPHGMGAHTPFRFNTPADTVSPVALTQRTC